MTKAIVENLYWVISQTKSEAETEQGSFDLFYSKFLLVVKNMLVSCYERQQEHVPILSETLQTAMIRQWQKISLRTLILEMRVCDQCGELGDGTKKEKYHKYAEVLLQSEEYLRRLYQDYPVMYECLLQSARHMAESIIELVERFVADKEELNRRFFPDHPARYIERLSGGESDSHNNGRKVYILELDNGEKLVYKPRNLQVDEAWGRFLQWASANAEMPYWWNRVWNRGEYGWCEWVEAKTCETYAQLGNYYVRNGILLCVSYLLGTEDLHYENLIAHGEYPITVDLEMAIGGRGNRGTNDGITEAERVYRESVLQTGILPLYAWNDEGEGVNVGAINGNGGQLVPLSMPVIVQAGTVDMHVEYRQPRMGEGKNLATWQGKFYEPYEFLEQIEDGFTRAYCFLMENRQGAVKRLEGFRNAPVRFLIRDTQQYAMLLLISYAPDYLMNEKDREAVLRNIEYRQPGQDLEEVAWITRQEVDALQKDDIPYFWYDIWGKELCSGANAVRERYFQAPVIQTVLNRLDRLNAADLRRQQKLIKAALSMGTKMLHGKKEKAVQSIATEPETGMNAETGADCGDGNSVKEAALAVAEKIGDILLEEAIWSEDRKEIGWISMMMAGYGEKSYLIRPMNLYLYDGLAGVAVFLAGLAKQTGKEPYQKIAETLVKRLFAHTEQLQEIKEKENFITGAYSGEASIAYAYLLLYSTQKKEILLHYLHKHCQALTELLPFDKQYDVLGGNAGAVLVLLCAYEQTKNREYLAWAEKAGEYLLQSGIRYDWGLGWMNPVAKTALTGFAHGASGMMLAFARLGYVTKNERFYQAARDAYDFEQHYYEAKRYDWKDLRYPEEESNGKGLAWCHGRGGILAARARTAEFTAGTFRKELEQSVREASGHLDMEEGREGDCLCHGSFGETVLLNCIGMAEAAEKKWRGLIRRLYCRREHLKEQLVLQECENYGLLGGMAGMGYACLLGREMMKGLLFIEERMSE